MTKLGTIILCVLLLLSFFLRFHNYANYPQRGATSDEYTYPFLGVSLLTKHVPISWSAFQGYKHRENLTIRGIYFPIVWPYFDHPPLYGLVVGSWMLLIGQSAFPKMDLAMIRIIPLFMAMFSSLLIFLIAKKIYSYKTAIWAVLIFSSATVFVINMRVSVAENLLTLIMLLSIYCYIIFGKKLNYKKIAILGVLSGLAFLTKVLGIVVFISILFFFISRGERFKNILIFSVIFVLIASLFPLYGAIYDWSLFLTIQGQQSMRDIGPETLPYILSTPIVVEKIVYDGWYIFGFIALFATSLNIKKNLYIVIPFLVYLTLLVFSLTKEGQSGWYLIPFFPLMSIAIATTVKKSIDDNDFFFFVFLLIVGFGQLQSVFKPIFGLSPMYFRVLASLVVLPPIIVNFLKNENIKRKIENAWFYLFILGSAISTYSYIHPT